LVPPAKCVGQAKSRQMALHGNVQIAFGSGGTLQNPASVLAGLEVSSIGRDEVEGRTGWTVPRFSVRYGHKSGCAIDGAIFYLNGRQRK